MIKVSDLRTLDVINVLDGRSLGVIKDIDLDIEQGKINALVLPGTSTSRFMGLFGKNEDMVISWDKIKKLGVDVILVEVSTFVDPRHE
ncbi:YlmC/YmxH family sporulation protein [Bacillota bacterium LX-D]|nr:YlmC/YmxH family sporulation protein [Bacillota bacterium LX-D]